MNGATGLSGPGVPEGRTVLEFLRQLVTGVTQAWQRLTISARVQIVLAALLTLGVIGGVVYFGAQPQYGRLYSGLNPEEAGEIASWLAENGIAYRMRQGGTAIDVPVGQIPEARVGLAAQDLPKSQGVVPGFELFEQRDLMSNRFLQDVDFMRALQGELQRTLNQYDFIRRSHVFIRESAEQLFVSEQQPSQATVTLDTTGPLTKAQVKAVLHTVSSFGGANLSPANVSITTTEGTLLHSPSQDQFASLANDKLEFQVALEQERQAKLERAFRQMGVNAIVNVSAVMDWTSEERRARQVTDGAVISSLESSSVTRDVELPPEGAPGAIANIPEELGRPGGEGTYTEDQELLENFDPSETVTTTTTHPGRVQQYKVAAYIEGDYVTTTDEDGNETTEYQPLTQEQITRYSEFITNAVGEGAEPTEVVVYDQPFRIERIAGTAAAPEVGAPWYETPLVQWTWRLGLVVLVFFAIRFLMRRALVLPTVEEEEVVEIPEVSPTERRRQEIAAEVERLSQEEPETVAALLRTWMSEED